MENFFDLFDETGLRARTARRALPFAGELAQNLLRLSQVVFGPRFVVRLLTVECDGFVHGILMAQGGGAFNLFLFCRTNNRF